MEDKILEMFFEFRRWQYAIDKGIGKHIAKRDLWQLTKPEFRVEMCQMIRDGKYTIAPPHTAKIPKDNGEFRTVYVNEPIDRIFLSIANDLLFDLMPEMIHPSCRSYQKGIGCGKVVQDIVARISSTHNQCGNCIGWKSDFTKYFDTVPLENIDARFDAVEAKWGKSAIIDVLRKYYHCDYYFDTDGTLQEKFQSLKQGCSVAAWLANVEMYSLDEKLSQMDGIYVRYSDDAIFIGPDFEKAMEVMKEETSKRGMTLNPQKIEYLTFDRWFKFLGFSIMGTNISLSSTKIKKFQKEIEGLTIKRSDNTLRKAINSVNKYLYKGNGQFSWATQILPICNVESDIRELDKFVMDCLRAVQTGKTKIGGLGYVATKDNGCIQRGKGKNVAANRQKTSTVIDGYMTIGCMQKALKTNYEAYLTLVSQL